MRKGKGGKVEGGGRGGGGFEMSEVKLRWSSSVPALRS